MKRMEKGVTGRESSGSLLPLLTTSAIGARIVKIPEMAASGVAAVTTKVAEESFNHASDRSFRRMYEKLLPDTETAASAAMADEGLMGVAASSISRRPDGGLVGACSIPVVVVPFFIASGNGEDPIASAAAAALPMLSWRAVGIWRPPAVEGGSRMDAMAAVGACSLSSVPVFGSSAIAGRKATAVVSTIASGSLRGVGPEYRL